MFHFQTPLALLLFLGYPVLIWLYIRRQTRGTGALKFSSLAGAKEITPTAAAYGRHIVFVLRLLAIAMVILALARPQGAKSSGESETEGVNISLVLDISPTMGGTDFYPTRIEAAKKVITEFINARKDDNIGLVVFSSEAQVSCPLTLDHAILNNLLGQVNALREGGTAIGLGLATAVTTLKNVKSKSKVIILLTDGDNNAGEIDPVTAAELANTFDIRIHTVGIGKPGSRDVMVNGMLMRISFDEALLRRLAFITGGNYFNAQDHESLAAVYKQIDSMEKVKIKKKHFVNYRELFAIFIILALVFLLAEIILSNTRFIKVP
ncbi:MAG: VWA domain-containing protein [Spirochaetes bacterium]|nr:VWA domain-containing protein [Spirochaetota bacterium]